MLTALLNTGDALGFGHPTAGVSLWQCDKERRCSRSLVSESDAHGLALSVPLRRSKLRVASLRVAMPQALRCATLASGIEGKI
ncbi:hypothetical protein [Nostoc sp.]|uniref:hypothetical protein n=1 Tax=Nostoc sp. TaxID=1180 RepID=UPI002FF59088